MQELFARLSARPQLRLSTCCLEKNGSRDAHGGSKKQGQEDPPDISARRRASIGASRSRRNPDCAFAQEEATSRFTLDLGQPLDGPAYVLNPCLENPHTGRSPQHVVVSRAVSRLRSASETVIFGLPRGLPPRNLATSLPPTRALAVRRRSRLELACARPRAIGTLGKPRGVPSSPQGHVGSDGGAVDNPGLRLAR